MNISHDIYSHPINHTKQGTYDWFSIDTEIHFKEKLKKYPSDTDLNFYLKNPITYNINDSGYRTPDNFNNSSEYGNMFLGCSHTFGVGLHLENTWSHILNNKIGGNFWNLGVPASGIQTGYRLFSHYVSKLKIKNLFILFPHIARYERFYPTTNIWEMHYFESPTNDPIFKSYNMSLMSEEVIYVTFLQSIEAIMYLCNLYSINVYFDFFKNINIMKECDFKNYKARDFQHFSTLAHINISNHFLNLYENNKTYNNEVRKYHADLKNNIIKF